MRIGLPEDCGHLQYIQGRSQDLNQPVQNIAQNFHDDVIIIDTDLVIVTPGKKMKNFKHCAISLNMLHTGGLCGVLWLTAPLSFYMSNL